MFIIVGIVASTLVYFVYTKIYINFITRYTCMQVTRAAHSQIHNGWRIHTHDRHCRIVFPVLAEQGYFS